MTGTGGRTHANVPKRLAHSDWGDLYQNARVQAYLHELVEQHRGLSRKLEQARLSELDRKALVKKHAELQPVSHVFQKVQEALKDLEEVLSLLHGERSRVRSSLIGCCCCSLCFSLDLRLSWYQR